MYLVLLIKDNKIEQQDKSLLRQDAAKLGARMVMSEKNELTPKFDEIESHLFHNSYYHGIHKGGSLEPSTWGVQLLWVRS